MDDIQLYLPPPHFDNWFHLNTVSRAGPRDLFWERESRPDFYTITCLTVIYIHLYHILMFSRVPKLEFRVGGVKFFLVFFSDYSSFFITQSGKLAQFPSKQKKFGRGFIAKTPR